MLKSSDTGVRQFDRGALGRMKRAQSAVGRYEDRCQSREARDIHRQKRPLLGHLVVLGERTSGYNHHSYMGRRPVCNVAVMREL